jgi:hypothetical protein
VSTLLKLMTRIYGWSIALYPSDFRQAFGDELRWVFELAVRDKAAEGWGRLIQFCLREMAGWGKAVGHQHLEAIRRRSRISGADRGTAQPGLHRQSLMRRAAMADESQRSSAPRDRANSNDVIAALPPLLFGVGIATTSLVRGGPWYTVPGWRLYLSVAIGLVPMLVIGIGAALALARRFPDWGWTWIGAALIGAALLVQSLVGEAEEAGRALPVWAETTLTLIFFSVGVSLLVTSAMRGVRRAGLFSLAAAGTFGLSMYLAIIAGPFFRHDLAPLAAPLGLVYSGLVYAYARKTGMSVLFPIVAVGVLNLASFILANQVWSEWLAAQSRSSPVVPLIILGTALLLSGPTLGWLLRPLRTAFGRPA